MKIIISCSDMEHKIATVLKEWIQNVDDKIDVEYFNASKIILNKEIKWVECDYFLPLFSISYLEEKQCLLDLGYIISKSERYDFSIKPLILDALGNEILIDLPILEKFELFLIEKDLYDLAEKILQKQVEENTILLLQEKIEKIRKQPINITKDATMFAMCSNLNYQDTIQCTGENGQYQLEYDFVRDGNTIPFEFISLSFDFENNIDLLKYLQRSEGKKISIELDIESECISYIDVEFKYGSQQILMRYDGIDLIENSGLIQLKMEQTQDKRYKEINEISLLIWKKYFKKNKGTIGVKNIFMINE